jgi:hypothetical protein
MLLLDYSSPFMVFSFAGGGVQSPHGMHWMIFLGWNGFAGWVEEPCMLCDAHLLLLQLHTCSFIGSGRGEMMLLFSVRHSVGRLSVG